MPLLTAEILSDRLRLSLPTVRALLKSGVIESVQVSPRGRRVTEEAFRQFIARGGVAGVAAHTVGAAER